MLARLALTAVVLAFAGLPAAAGTHPDNVRVLPRWNLTAAQLRADCTTQIALARRRINALAARAGRRTAANTLVPLENITADLSDATVADEFMFYVSPSAEVRDASQECVNALGAFYSEFQARPDVYRALQFVAAGKTATAPYQTEMLEFYLIGARASGAALTPAARKTFVALERELQRIRLEFASTIQNDRSSITLAEARTQGLDPNFLASLKKNDDGSYTVPVNESTVGPFMQSERDATAREAFYMAYNNRGGESNVKLLERAIAIRDRLARLLGYQTWADDRLANRMVNSPARIVRFLANIDSRLLGGARNEVAALAQLKAEDTGAAESTLQPWDFSYYDNVLRKTKYAVDGVAIRPYFPVQHTIDSVLAIYSKMLGVQFRRGADDAWLPAPQVLHYTVWDTASGRFLGDSYFDLYPRPGKYAHFANFPLLPNRLLPDGKTRAPLAVIVGNWPVPAPGKPALLSHAEVETFFHEFGHNMAAMLATAPYETLSGGFKRDFVEAPSQMLENFVWQPSILKEISSRYDTGAPLPDDLIQKIVAARYVDQASFYTTQAFYAVVDMKYHTSGPKVDTTRVWANLKTKMTALPYVEGTIPQAAFNHLMGGGYDAGYYGYLWSRVYAQDMFTRFQRQGIESAAAGRAYRTDILAPAMTYEPDREVRAFLGRPMSPDAFYATLGLTPAAPQ